MRGCAYQYGMNFPKHHVCIWLTTLLLTMSTFPVPTDAQAQTSTARLGCALPHAEIEINAPYELVYETVIDTSRYPEWNPYITRVDPPVDLSVVGSEFTLHVLQPISMTTVQSNEKTFEAQPPANGEALLAYGYNDLFKLLLGSPVRYHLFTALDDGRTLYRTYEEFCTILLPLLPLDDVQLGFTLQTEALKAEVERLYAAGDGE